MKSLFKMLGLAIVIVLFATYVLPVLLIIVGVGAVIALIYYLVKLYKRDHSTHESDHLPIDSQNKILDKSVSACDNKTDKITNNCTDESSANTSVTIQPVIHKLRRKLYDFVVFDIETTGLNRSADQIIQLSAVKYKNDKVVDQFDSFINPHRKLEQNIVFLTGITDNDLVNAPDLDEVLNQFTEFIEDLPLIGHNIIKFDLPFLYAHGFSVADVSVIDTVKLSSRKLPELENHKLPTLKKFYGINNASHNALLDCQTNAIVYQKLRDDDLERVEVDISTIPQTLKGKRVCITGQFIGVSRNELIDEIVEHGGKYTKAVSGLTDYLLDGTQLTDQLTDGVHSSSELKAVELQNQNGKIQVINYEQFEELINNQDLEQIS